MDINKRKEEKELSIYNKLKYKDSLYINLKTNKPSSSNPHKEI